MSARFYLGAALIVGALDLAPARAGPPTEQVASCASYAPEAAIRSGLSTEIVLRVMAAESGGNPQIVSPKGAMGCMQIMPATWVTLSSRFRLGTNPYDPRQNMIAGAAYLAELTKRYGLPGALAAYNAGPARYARYFNGRSALPAETIAYAARIGRGSAAAALSQVARWQEAALFLPEAARSMLGESPSRAAQTTSRDDGDSLFPLLTRHEHRDVAPPRP